METCSYIEFGDLVVAYRKESSKDSRSETCLVTRSKHKIISIACIVLILGHYIELVRKIQIEPIYKTIIQINVQSSRQFSLCMFGNKDSLLILCCVLGIQSIGILMSRGLLDRNLQSRSLLFLLVSNIVLKVL